MNFSVGHTVYFPNYSKEVLKEFPNRVFTISGEVTNLDYVDESGKCHEYEITKQNTKWYVKSEEVFATREECDAYLDNLKQTAIIF